MAALPARRYNPDGSEQEYGFFDYGGYCINLAISQDDPEMTQACHEAGYLNPKCDVLGWSGGLVSYAKSKGATKVAKWMSKNGYPE